MLQDFWIIDFVGMFIARAIIAFILIRHALVLKKISRSLSVLHFFSAVFIFFGIYSSFVSLFWITILIGKILIDRIKFKRSVFENREYLYLLAFFFFLLFVGPGRLSIDRIFNIRF